MNVTIATYTTGWWGPPEDESRMHFEYSIDGNKSQPIEITNKTISTIPGSTLQFDGLISLYRLSEGNHTLMVKAVLDYYMPGETTTRSIHTESIANAYLIIDTNPGNTTKNAQANSGLEFVIPVFGVIALVAVCVSLYYYLRIRR